VVRLGHTHVGHPLGENPLLQVLSVGYLAIWVWSAVAPLDRDTWWLENLLVFGWVGLLAATHRQFVFSNLSYALMLAFLALHAVGSHYTYSTVPLGAWLQEAFEQERNHYDRAVHFAFGALLPIPFANSSSGCCTYTESGATCSPPWSFSRRARFTRSSSLGPRGSWLPP
jgi:hypothetical protein